MTQNLDNQTARGNPSANHSSSIYNRVTERIITSLVNGVVPWRKPWKGREFLPCNAVSNLPYRGVNIFLLGMAPYADHRWMTARQANELGGHVRKGERGSVVVFWKILVREANDTDPKRTTALLRHFHVFNIEQIEGVSLGGVSSLTPVNRIEQVEHAIRAMLNPPRFVGHPTQAFYRPGDDTIAMPRIERFDSPDHYYATLMHELGHATGHPTRLNRPGVAETGVFGSEDYGREELVAELVSAFVCAELGLDNSLIENSASYINGWLDALSRDPKAVIKAASQARHAADYILGKHSTE